MRIGLVIAIIIVIGLSLAGYSLQQEKESSPDRVVVTNFEECAEAGNPVMESYPRQCIHEGEHFVEEISENELPPVGDEVTPKEEVAVIECDPNNRPEACTKEYAPVCGLVQVQCITTPCNPVPETFSTGCVACSNQNVISYTEGECELKS